MKQVLKNYKNDIQDNILYTVWCTVWHGVWNGIRSDVYDVVRKSIWDVQNAVWFGVYKFKKKLRI